MDLEVIVIDGKTYHSVDEVPPDIREKYEEAIPTIIKFRTRLRP